MRKETRDLQLHVISNAEWRRFTPESLRDGKYLQALLCVVEKEDNRVPSFLWCKLKPLINLGFFVGFVFNLSKLPLSNWCVCS